MELFAYIEPADSNCSTYSHRIQQLLMRACVEIEANCAAILRENRYSRPRHALTMGDYRLINHTHRLSSYEVRLPTWRGREAIRRPFASWTSADGRLKWHEAYNRSKHGRHEYFSLATFGALIDAISGLVVVLSAQFHQEDYSPSGKSLSIGEGYSYDTDDSMSSAIGGYFRVRFPTDWPLAERYDFKWDELESLEDPFEEIDYEAYRSPRPPGHQREAATDTQDVS